MSGYVVRQAVKDLADQVIGNEILFQQGKEELYNSSQDNKAAETINGFLLQNNDKIYDGKLIFITFTPMLLFMSTHKIFEKEKLVIQIEDDVLVNPLSQVLVKRYREDGYHFAINDFQFSAKYMGMLECVEYLKVNVLEYKDNPVKLENIVKLAKSFHKKCIITGINTKEDYDYAAGLSVDYLEGTYASGLIRMKASKAEFLQGNFFELVIAVMKEEPDIGEIEEIISRDAYLTYALLRLVNSKYFTAAKKISSVRQGLMIMGIGQLRQWIYLLSLQGREKEEDQAAAEELLRVSFLRGTFCRELSAYCKDFPFTSSQAYIMGMFSTLNYLVDAPMEEILKEIPIDEALKAALISQEGICGELYGLVLDYEKADWQSINRRVEILGIPSNMVAKLYLSCVKEVQSIWESISQPTFEEGKRIEGQEEREEGSYGQGGDLE